ncbi:TetR/AcrR family transcriptional regulator [Paenibacillus borealis]|uniref:TetR family transcriptional regulator n=1 Tax=Paenibacillus borealis TaxID=160799 RepID=A0A089LAU9_PAEBO|nr:TetR/AcrR family transcriptional regulator [Paenibacillus borealis]AIQ58636.1 TetR family transcriptional regulator [Paenibacillus borealis]
MSLDPKKSLTQSKLLKKIIPAVMKDGFQQLKMEEIAKLMDVSRATMYKHFSSKEEVIAGVVYIFVDYIDQLKLPSVQVEGELFGVSFQQLFEQSVSLAGKISEVFLKELQGAYPELSDSLKSALLQRESQSLEFYRHGIDQGIFQPINERFILLQDELLLREIMNTKYLLQNQTSIQQVLTDYYQFKKVQLFRPEKMGLIDDHLIIPVINHVAEKYNRTL